MYKIIQNILPESILVEIKSEMELLEYKLCEQSVGVDINKLSSYSNIQEFPVHMFSFYQCSNPEVSHNIGVTIYNALKYFMQDEFTGYNLLRFHAAKSVKQNYYPRHKHTIPHSDCYWFENKCKTILFYLDDSDGTTLFFNEPISENFYDDIGTRQFTISHENIPKRNSAIIFNSILVHAMRPPLAYDSRTIFNIVLEKL
jgi:hypothetical protein